MTRQPGRLVVSGMAVGLATLAVMLASEPGLAIVWDEGYTLGREARLREWFRALRDPPRFAAEWVPPTLELVQSVGVTASPSRSGQYSRKAAFRHGRPGLFLAIRPRGTSWASALLRTARPCR